MLKRELLVILDKNWQRGFKAAEKKKLESSVESAI
jgi:hypothetical protein